MDLGPTLILFHLETDLDQCLDTKNIKDPHFLINYYMSWGDMHSASAFVLYVHSAYLFLNKSNKLIFDIKLNPFVLLLLILCFKC